MADQTIEAENQADQIRAFVTKAYIDTARSNGKTQFIVRAGDVHQAMNLNNAVPAVCSVLAGHKFRDSNGLELVSRDGPDVSTTTTFTYSLATSGSFGVKRAEAILRQRYGASEADTDKMVSFGLPDGRAVALQRDIAKVQLWFEDDPKLKPPPVQFIQAYPADKGRHSNLPARLRHDPPASLQASGFPRPVISARASSEAELFGLLSWYEALVTGDLNRAALGALKAKFLARYPDFPELTFAAKSGSYFEDERAYKDDLLGAAHGVVAAGVADDINVGAGLLDILTGKKSGLLGWRTDGRIKAIRQSRPGLLEAAASKLATGESPPEEAVGEFVEQMWPVLLEGQEKNQPFSESRNIPSMLLALVKPADAIGINTSPLMQVSEAILGRSILKNQPMTAQEYSQVLAFTRQLFSVMRDEWLWAPRDLWDVQGFIWAVSRTDGVNFDQPTSDTSNQERNVMPPTNVILYGPPGTGKTYRTAQEAVFLCDGHVPEGRPALMARYNALRDAGQIDFVTFHQSYAYEDFVEGLRPQTGSDEGVEGSATSGFRLEPRNGIFREICALAEQARKRPSGTGAVDLSGRQFFKMSLGRAGQDDHVFDEAIKGDYVVLGWGGEVDWSDPKYADYNAVFERWNELEPNTSGNSGNISQVWRFRGSMQEGDIVVVSEGNSKFRAIGEVIGDYEYNPTGFETYNHRRKVKWLLVLDNALPVETIYDGPFTMASCYLLKGAKIKREALSRLLPGAHNEPVGPPDQFVLIIDEINRANVSKVFGELITLIESDKRLGEANALEVKLPYSGDKFGVPANLHIVGTMNTADRSIALLDTALRRRFQFRELMPEPERLEEQVDGVPLQQVLKGINDRIEYLFDRDHQIGHAFFMGCTSKDAIDAVMRDKVIPLLVEYFYENWEKVRQVLGESRDEGAFIVRSKISAPPGSENDFGQDRYRYTVQPAFELAAYSQLLG